MAATGRARLRNAARSLGLGLVILLVPAAPAAGQARGSDEVGRVYRLLGDPLLWHEGGRLSSAGESAIRLLQRAGEHGLDPADYDAALLDSLAGRADGAGPAERKRLDLLLTADVLRYLDHLRGGRAPGRPGEEITAALRSAIAANALPVLVAALEPRLVQYRLLQEALARYRRLARETAVPPLTYVRPVRPGDPYEGAADLARHLAALGDLPADALPPPGGTYAGPLVDAAVRFQERHGLVADGVLRPATFTALNIPLAWRVRQLELAMERLRRLPPLHGERLVVVNLPALRLYAFDSVGTLAPPALVMRAVVGSAGDTRTPTLFQEMRYVDFWPYWNIPRSILLEEILPVLRQTPDYLGGRDMELVDAGGQVVGDRVTAERLERLRRGELRVRRRPGPGNPLGLVKFAFPNANGIYIHDTSQPELFALLRRDLSHGCIRIADPAALATWVLEGQGGWTADSTAAAIAGGRSRRVHLEHPLPVAVFYTTAVVGGDRRVYFHDDLYRLDRQLDAELRLGAYLP
jgi:murein L,D-transpeptidase YcbB/YkuD